MRIHFFQAVTLLPRISLHVDLCVHKLARNKGIHFDSSLVYLTTSLYLILEEPSSDVVADGAGIVDQLKVSLGFALLGRFGLAKFRVLAQMFAHHLLQVGLVSGFGYDALFLQHGQDTHLLLNQLDSRQQVHTKIDKGPLDTLLFVLFLLLDKHVMVEELLETLVGVVDEELFQCVELENLKTGNVQNAL